LEGPDRRITAERASQWGGVFSVYSGIRIRLAGAVALQAANPVFGGFPDLYSLPIPAGPAGLGSPFSRKWASLNRKNGTEEMGKKSSGEPGSFSAIVWRSIYEK
jgi:hypothetical protein